MLVYFFGTGSSPLPGELLVIFLNMCEYGVQAIRTQGPFLEAVEKKVTTTSTTHH